VLVESLACGTPIVAADHSASRERVQPGTGRLCLPDDAGALAEACVAAFDLTVEPGISDRCRAVAMPYDWDAQVPVYERIYDGSEPVPAATVPPPSRLGAAS
jgi:glycosyltransferase involved in cell wall biosynthesis